MDNNNSLTSIEDLLTIWSNTSLQICHRYKLKEQTAILTLLFYQYCYLRELSDEQRLIYTSYYEDNIHLNIAIVSGKSGRYVVSIKRFLFKKEVYDKIDKVYGKIKSVVIDKEILDFFAKLYEEEIELKSVKPIVKTIENGK